MTLFIASGCGGGSSGSSSPSAGSGGDTSGGGDMSLAGDTGTGGKTGTAGKTGSGGKGGTGAIGSAGEAGEAGAGGEGPTGPVKFPPATVFVSASATKLSSPNFTLIGSIGEPLGGTTTSTREKSAKYIYIPGVVAGTTQ